MKTDKMIELLESLKLSKNEELDLFDTISEKYDDKAFEIDDKNIEYYHFGNLSPVQVKPSTTKMLTPEGMKEWMAFVDYNGARLVDVLKNASTDIATNDQNNVRPKAGGDKPDSVETLERKMAELCGRHEMKKHVIPFTARTARKTAAPPTPAQMLAAISGMSVEDKERMRTALEAISASSSV